MALARVQATPQASAGGSTVAVTFSAPPTVGHSVVVVVTAGAGGGAVGDTTCTDSHGNVYTLVRTEGSVAGGVVHDVWLCAALAATGTPFTITTSGGSKSRCGVAIEVSGVGAGLVVDQMAGVASTGVGTATAGPTAALAASEVFLVGCLSVASASASITVGTATPAWTEEAEQDTGIVGEVDSRVLTSAGGTTPSVTWTWAGAAFFSASIVAFKASGSAAPPEYILTVDLEEIDIQLGSLNLRRPASGMHTLTCDIESPDGTYRPPLDAEVVLYEDGGTSPIPKIFGGLIQTTRERAQTGWGAPILVEIAATDFSLLAQRRVISDTFATGTLKSQLQSLVDDHLAAIGITLDPAQVDGPTVAAITFDATTGKDALDALVKNTEAAGNPMIWRIDYDKVLSFFQPGSQAAPFDIAEGDGNTVGDITTELSRAEGYANRIIVKYGTGTKLQTQTWTGDGVTVSFTTDLPAELAYRPGGITRIIDIVSSSVAADSVITTVQPHQNVTGDRVRISGHSGSTPNLNTNEDRRVTVLSSTTFSITEAVSVGGTGGVVRDTVPLITGTYPATPPGGIQSHFQWEPPTHTVTQPAGDTPIASGTRLELTYSAQYPITVIVDSSPPGTIDKVIEAPGIFTEAEAIALGEAELLRLSSDLRRVEYRTHGRGLEPGQTQTVTESFRQLAHSCLIAEITTRDISANEVEHQVSLIADDQFRPSWRKVYEDWLGGATGVSSGSGSTATEIPPDQPIGGEDGDILYNDAGNISGTSDVALEKLVAASAASLLVGRGGAAGAGDFQEIVLGTNLSMTGTTLNATGGGGSTWEDGFWTPITNGDPVSPELLFDSDGACIVGFVPTP